MSKFTRAIYGKKLMMTQLFDEEGKVMPITVIEARPNIATQVKTTEKDGYSAVQYGAGEKKHFNKSESGHLKGQKSAKLFEAAGKDSKVGDEITLEILKVGEKVNVTGISKGKGFAGTVKRHHFHTGPKTHGGNNYRQPGSIGAQQPQRVIKGKRMGGHMGAEQVTTKNLTVFKLDKENNRIYLQGAVPGANNSGILVWSPLEMQKESENES